MKNRTISLALAVLTALSPAAPGLSVLPETIRAASAVYAAENVVVNAVRIRMNSTPTAGSRPADAGISVSTGRISGIRWIDMTEKRELDGAEAFAEGHVCSLSVYMDPPAEAAWAVTSDGYPAVKVACDAGGTETDALSVMFNQNADGGVTLMAVFTFTVAAADTSGQQTDGSPEDGRDDDQNDGQHDGRNDGGSGSGSNGGQTGTPGGAGEEESPTVKSASVRGARIPAEGQLMQVTGFDASPCIVRDAGWFNVTDNMPLETGETFAEGKEYCVSLFLLPPEGKSWAPDARVTMTLSNGKTAVPSRSFIQMGGDGVAVLIGDFILKAVSAEEAAANAEQPRTESGTGTEEESRTDQTGQADQTDQTGGETDGTGSSGTEQAEEQPSGSQTSVTLPADPQSSDPEPTDGTPSDTGSEGTETGGETPGSGIAAEPSDLTAKPGDTAVFRAAANGGIRAVRWIAVNGDEIIPLSDGAFGYGSELEGTATASLTVKKIAREMNGLRFACIFIGADGSTISTRYAVLTVGEETGSGAGAEAAPFSDVKAGDWYYPSVSQAAALGLMNGRGNGLYEPDGTVTFAEAVKLAAVIRERYETGTVTLQNGDPWYATYADYADGRGILTDGGAWGAISKETVLARANEPVTRSEFAWIFSRALPAGALAAVNDIPDGAIPDLYPDGGEINVSAERQTAIYALYRAGILNGSDEIGTFRPWANIKRSEVAAIAVRMCVPEERVGAPSALIIPDGE